jgi:8-oxo-dGTP diphosphatase
MGKINQGVKEGRYVVIPRTVIFIIRDDSVLLIKGAPTKKIWSGKYNGIGGHIEKGEDVTSAACRELKEETGLSIKPLSLCGTVTIDLEENTGILLFVFRGIYENGELLPSTEGSLEWIPINKIDLFPVVEDLPFLLEKTLAMEPGVPAFSARYSYDEAGALHIDLSS